MRCHHINFNTVCIENVNIFYIYIAVTLLDCYVLIIIYIADKYNITNYFFVDSYDLFSILRGAGTMENRNILETVLIQCQNRLMLVNVFCIYLKREILGTVLKCIFVRKEILGTVLSV